MHLREAPLAWQAVVTPAGWDHAERHLAGFWPTKRQKEERCLRHRRLYISRDNGEEYKCKIEGHKMLERGKNDVPSTAPAPPAAAPSVKP